MQAFFVCVCVCVWAPNRRSCSQAFLAVTLETWIINIINNKLDLYSAKIIKYSKAFYNVRLKLLFKVTRPSFLGGTILV